MKSVFEIRNNTNPNDAKNYDTRQIREKYLIENLLLPDQCKIVYTDYDRMIVAGIVPITEKIKLEPIAYQKADYFNQRRETGIINVGATGKVIADDQEFELNYKDALYVGLGVKNITFESKNASEPAKFYINSCLANQKHPNKKVVKEEANPVRMGSTKNTNDRILNQYIVPDIVKTNQLMMGVTEVLEGNAWNTMPCHLHPLRMEAYFYFEIPEDQAACHFMGQPEETRHIWMHNEQCVLSPAWSIHSAAGTSNYCFIWGMAGSDSDVDPIKIKELR